MINVPQVYNKRDKDIPAGAVYVGRPTKWGNPYVIGKDGSRADVIEKFEEALLLDDVGMDHLEELRGKDLVCWCAPLPCHADVLMKYANR